MITDWRRPAIQESELSGQKVSEMFPVQLLQVPGAVLWLMHTLDHAAFSFPMITNEISAHKQQLINMTNSRTTLEVHARKNLFESRDVS